MRDPLVDRFARRLGEWAERPTALPPRAARTRVLAALPGRRRSTWRLATAGAALAALLALVLVVGRHSQPVVEPPPDTPIAQRTIVHQLSSGTKLYIVMRPSGPAAGS